jgi:hypothetical protein
VSGISSAAGADEVREVPGDVVDKTTHHGFQSSTSIMLIGGFNADGSDFTMCVSFVHVPLLFEQLGCHQYSSRRRSGLTPRGLRS